MGLPAVRAAGQPPPRPDDIVLRGYFASVDEGRVGRRVLVGFGSGAAELRTAVEGYQMTAQGLRPLGRGEVRSEGGKLPGMVLPGAVLAATASPIGLIVGGTAKVVVEDGLSEGERVIVEGIQKVRTGMAVAVSEAPPARPGPGRSPAALWVHSAGTGHHTGAVRLTPGEW